MSLPNLLVTFLLTSVFHVLVTGQWTQNFHSGLSQSASVACVLDGNFTLTFFLDSGSDPIGAIYLVNQTDPTDTTEASFNIGSGVTGTGTSQDPYMLSVCVMEAPWSPGSFVLLPEIEQRKAVWQNDEILSVHVMVKSNKTLNGNPFDPKIVFADDVLYVASCNLTETKDTVVTTGQINATGSVSEVATVLSHQLSMEVRSSSGNTTNVAVGGDDVLLRTFVKPSDPLLAYVQGVYAYNCDVCDTPDCSGAITVNLIDVDGCSTGYVSGFKSTGAPIAETDYFGVFKLYNQDYMFFRCYANVCYEPNSPKCNNYCTYRKALPVSVRKRRDATEEKSDAEPSILTTFLRVTLSDNNEIMTLDSSSDPLQKTSKETVQKEDVERMALVGSVVVLGVLLVVGLIVAIVVFLHIGKTKATVKTV